MLKPQIKMVIFTSWALGCVFPEGSWQQGKEGNNSHIGGIYWVQRYPEFSSVPLHHHSKCLLGVCRAPLYKQEASQGSSLRSWPLRVWLQGPDAFLQPGWCSRTKRGSLWSSCTSEPPLKPPFDEMSGFPFNPVSFASLIRCSSPWSSESPRPINKGKII